MAQLIFIDKNFSERVYKLLLERTTVGRGNENTLVIDDPSVSSRHCEILVYGTEVIARDLDSHNGTFVDGFRLNKQSQVKSGQIVRFGAVEARLELDPIDDEPDASEITAIYAHSRAMRDKKRAQGEPKPTDAFMHLESPPQLAPEEHTVILKQADVSPQNPVPSPIERIEWRRTSSGRKVVIVAIVAALGLVILLWWLLK